ncbi:primase C-terminal domain-containing protein, partial [Patescibacteria group bacterium]|nr:primase C-terminal domain-containing protein [Patescibacteria group bacterium]
SSDLLAQYITSQFVAHLAKLGADMNAMDVSRVLRLPGTTNSKSGSVVEVDIWRTKEHELLELYDYCPPLEKPKKGRGKRSGELRVFPPKKGIIDLYSLNEKRMNDIDKLVSLRSGEMIGYRNMTLYIYAFTVAMLVKTQASTMVFCRQLNEKLNDPLLVKEIEKIVKSAYSDATEFLTAFAENEMKMRGLPNNLIKPMKASTVIKKLAITREEMKEMRTLIDGTVRKERDTERKREKRREQGMQERAEYLQSEEDKTTEKVEQLRKYIEENPKVTRKILADKLNVSVYRVDQLKRILKSL